MSAYNCGEYIEEAIYSILNQSYPNFELIIADDGSTDNTKAIIDGIKDDRIIRYHNEVNIGLLHTWNKLIDKTTGYYVTWQDGDDISYPKRLEKLVAAMDGDSDLALCGSNYCRPFHNWHSLTTSDFPSDSDEIKRRIDAGEEVPFCGTRVLIKREVLGEVGKFREFYHKNGWEDFDLFCRIVEKHKTGNIPDVLYEYRYFPQSASKVKLSQITAKKIFIQDIGFYLAGQRKANNGLDGLMPGGDSAGLDTFLEKMNQRLKGDRSLGIRKIVKNRCSNKDFKAAVYLLPKAIAANPSKIENWTLILFWSKSFFRSCVKYILELVTGRSKHEYRRYRYNI